MTARQKKLLQKKLERLSESDMAEIWKINFNKKLSADELEQFEALRKEYKKRSGKILPPNNFDKKSKRS